MEAEIRKQFAAEIELIPGTGGIYEIKVNGVQIFSKHAAGRFAEPEEIINLIKDKTA